MYENSFFGHLLHSSRFKSFIWRLGATLGIATLTFITTNIDMFNLPTIAVGIVSLLAGEATKALSNYLSGKVVS